MSNFARIAIWHRSHVTTLEPDKQEPKEAVASDEGGQPEPVTLDFYRTERDSALNRLFGEQGKRKALR